jgi:hypothetical protein
MVTASSNYNQLFEARYVGGWPGLFKGESQRKSLERAISQVNGANRVVVAAVTDRWSFWKRLGVALLAIITLGFIVKVPNVLLVTAPSA